MSTLIFDLDGTLVDCKELHQFAFRESILYYCPECEYNDEQVEGRPTLEKVRIIKSLGYNFNIDKVNQMKQMLTQRHINEYVQFNQELHSELYRLKERHKLTLASNATELFVNRVLEITKLKQLFEVINTATDFPPKPDPFTYIDCMRKTDSTSENTIIFEDSPIGIAGANNTGAKVIEVLDSKDLVKKLKLIT